MADQKRYEVKQTGQARQFSPGDPNSLARYLNFNRNCVKAIIYICKTPILIMTLLK